MTRSRNTVPALLDWNKQLNIIEDNFFKNFGTIHEALKPWIPYNVFKNDEGNIVLEIAVAGYSKENITVEARDGEIRVSGNGPDESETKFVHKGIANRAFNYVFPLQALYEVVSAELKNGILRIETRKNKEVLNLIEIKDAA